MNYIRKHKIFKLVAVTLIFNLLLDIFLPVTAYALTAGPNSPEFSSFEPVATTDMVHPFTGDFTYNLPVIEIPGPDGAGYAMSLSYHSGSSVEEEASWVGYGWSLNPGAINRGTRGFPDDFNGDAVKQYNKTDPNWSASASRSVGLEATSIDTKISEDGDTSVTSIAVSLSSKKSLRFNNYQGFSRQVGMNVGVKGIGNVGMNRSSQGVTFEANIDVAGILSKAVSDFKKKNDNEKGPQADTKIKLVKLGTYFKNKVKAHCQDSTAY